MKSPLRATIALTPLLLTAATPMLPERVLRCTLARITNVDTKREQSEAELITEGSHRLDVMLPAIPVRTAPPPDPIDAAEPVDPRTRILADPDGLTQGFPKRFDRVVDYWPSRVELTTSIDDPLVNLIIISAIDPSRHVARLFMARATDLATYDLKHIYRGTCTIDSNGIADSGRF